MTDDSDSARILGRKSNYNDSMFFTKHQAYGLTTFPCNRINRIHLIRYLLAATR